MNILELNPINMPIELQCDSCHYTSKIVVGAFIPTNVLCPNCGSTVSFSSTGAHLSNEYGVDGSLLRLNLKHIENIANFLANQLNAQRIIADLELQLPVVPEAARPAFAQAITDLKAFYTQIIKNREAESAVEAVEEPIAGSNLAVDPVPVAVDQPEEAEQKADVATQVDEQPETIQLTNLGGLSMVEVE